MPTLPPPTRFPSPPLTEKFAFRVDPATAAAIRDLARRHNTRETTVMRCAIERGLPVLLEASQASDQAIRG